VTQETVFSVDTSSIKFGPGSISEVGEDLTILGVRRAMWLCDPNLVGTDGQVRLAGHLADAGIEFELFDAIRTEPSLDSFKAAADFSVQGNFDGFLAMGGGSTIDTGKIANLFSVYPNDFFAYVNAPIGQGKPVPGPLKPMIGVPTTAGTSSEITGVAIFDDKATNSKTGISHRFMRPSMGVQDPELTIDLPPMVTACTGLDVLCHAIESYTTIDYTSRPKPEGSLHRPTYQGSSPVSDIWACEAIRLVAQNLPRVLRDPADLEARSNMMLAAVYGGMGFGNAGVHLCHGMSYPVSSLVREYRAPDYLTEHPLVPHGMSVVLNAPAVFRFTAAANPAKHLEAARLMGRDVSGVPEAEAGELLADCLIEIMKATMMPNGLEAVGYGPADAEVLAEKTLPQHRVTKLSPRPADGNELTRLFLEAMRIW